MARPPPPRRLLSLVAILGALALTLGCSVDGGKVAVGSVRESVPVAPSTPAVRAVRVALGAGEIAFARSENGAVDVEAEVRVVPSRAGSFRAPLTFADHVRVRRDGDQVLVSSAHDGAADAGDFELRLVVRVPDAVGIDAELGAGRVTADLRSTQDLTVRIGAGQAQLKAGRVDGLLRAVVTSGEANVQVLEQAAGGATVEVGTGNAELSLPADVPGEFAVSSGVGNVHVAADYGLDTQREGVGAAARGKRGTGGKQFTVQVNVGNAALR